MAKRGLIVFLSIVIGLLGIVGISTYYVDPFFHYHAPKAGFAYVVDDKINQNPGMAANMEYDSFLTGSSMTANFNAKDFSKEGGKVLKLCYDGAYPADLNSIMGIVFDPTTRARRHNPVKAAFIGVDLLVYTADVDEHKFPLTEYLYDNNPWNDTEYLFNKTVFVDYVVKPMLEKQGTDLDEVYRMDWLTPEMFGKDYVLGGYVPADAKEEEAAADLLIEQTGKNLACNILPYVEAHPETTFTFFFPAYSILFWNNVEREQMLEARLAQTEYLGETLLRYPNVRVFYFSDCEDIITDFDKYTDYTHHSEAVSRFEAESMMRGAHEVTPGGMKAKTDHMRQIVRSYDFEGLLGDH